MEKRKNTKFRAIDIIVIIVCISGIVLNIVLFWKDLNRTLTKLYEEHIAVVSYKYKAAQRKFLDRVLWDRLRQESPVYNGDIIRTAELSEARITFLDGQYIELLENTLAQIFWDKKEILIDFAGGDININSHVGSNAVVLASGNNRVEVASGGVLNARTNSSNQALNIMLLEGSGSITSSSGEIQSINAGSALSFLQDGTQDVMPMVAVLSPVPGTQVLNSSHEDFPINFIWKANNFGDGEFVYIEISKESSFNRMVYSSEVRDVTETEVMLSSGAYWWRIYPSSFRNSENNIKNAASGRLTINYAPSPRLISPVENYVYAYRAKLPAVRFLWTGTERAAAYRLDVANNPRMENPVVSRQLYDLSLVLSTLEEGTWYWRVTPLYPADFLGSSYPPSVSSFVINKSGSLEPPVLSSPAVGNFVNIAKESKDTYFSWRNESEAASYTIKISKISDLSNPVIQRELKENWYIYKPRQQSILEEGVQYYWGVFQTDIEGNSSLISEIRSFFALSGEIIQRTLFPPDNYIIADARIPDTRFTWRTNLPFATRFQVSEQSDFSSLLIDDEVIVTSIQGKTLAVGDYYWRIFSEASDKTATFATPEKHFSVVAPLSAPIAEIPAQDDKVVVREKVPVDFSWSAVHGANYYQIKLYRAGSNQESVSEYASENRISLLMDNLPDGDYRWTIQAFIDESTTSSRRTSLLGIYNFSMKKLNPVILSTPYTGYAFEGLQALRSPGVVTWSSKEEVAASRFILSRNANPLADTSLVMDIKNPPNTIQLIPLNEGRWYWTIIAETPDGFDISARSPLYFIVNSIPLLPVPGGRTPENRYTIGPAELRETKTIIFSWNSVEGANGYVFTVFQEGERANQRKLLHTAIVDETTYELEDLSVLDRGNFVWQVEAVSKTEEVIEQRGTVGQNSFIINLPQVNKPQAKQPGILYGK
ncbi:MAG: hypothetical protein FWF38_02095 [Spirochaetaceae bacterium]|nr:hypothetical protein [Spirochaetaceae bacterium]